MCIYAHTYKQSFRILFSRFEFPIRVKYKYYVVNISVFLPCYTAV